MSILQLHVYNKSHVHYKVGIITLCVVYSWSILLTTQRKDTSNNSNNNTNNMITMETSIIAVDMVMIIMTDQTVKAMGELILSNVLN